MTQITADDDGDSDDDNDDDDDDSDDDNVDGDNDPNHLTTNRGSSSHRGSSEVRTGSANQTQYNTLLKHAQNNCIWKYQTSSKSTLSIWKYLEVYADTLSMPEISRFVDISLSRTA